jgi:hypothetical protein
MEPFDTRVRELAIRRHLSEASVRHLVDGLFQTGGAQVQFDLAELGGMGQWMHGLVMTSDLFNNDLKARIDAICGDISEMIRSNRICRPAPPLSGTVPGVSLSWNKRSNWWPGNFGVPSSSGSQDNLRYAWFRVTRRLAVDVGGSVWVYDTGDHQISRVSQQQSGSGMTLTFTSQHGVVEVAALPIVHRG